MRFQASFLSLDVMHREEKHLISLAGCLNMVRKRKEDFSNYVSNALQQSMVTGVPQIAKAGSIPKKILRSLVFCCCIAGFVYQSLSFMSLYWEYDVVTDMRVERPTLIDWPGFTICLQNGFEQVEFCNDPAGESLRKKYNLSCYQFDEEYVNEMGVNDICQRNERLCFYNGTVIPRTNLRGHENLYTAPREEIEPWMFNASRLAYYCKGKLFEDVFWSEKEQKAIKLNLNGDTNWLLYPSQYSGKWRESCVSGNTLIGRPDYRIPKTTPDVDLFCGFEDRRNLMPWTERKNSYYYSIHSQYSMKNPFTGAGFFVPPDKIIRVLPTLEKRIRLPYPYKTDCMDYLTQWRQRGGRGATNVEECILECKRNASMEKFGCITKEVLMPEYYGPDPRCGSETPLGTLNEDGADCIKNCKEPCYEEKYTLKFIQQRRKNHDDECEEDQMNFGWESYKVEVYFSQMNVKTFTYKPKFEAIEVFSYIGGYIGMWLGISFIAVFDFFEMLVMMSKYPLRRMKYRCQGIKNDKIRKFQKHSQ